MSIQILHVFCYKFANVTRVLLCEIQWVEVGEHENKPNKTHIPYVNFTAHGQKRSGCHVRTHNGVGAQNIMILGGSKFRALEIKFSSSFNHACHQVEVRTESVSEFGYHSSPMVVLALIILFRGSKSRKITLVNKYCKK